MLTYHNDNARTGQYLQETLLKPGLVKNGYVDPNSKVKYVFGRMFARVVDGAICAQPLYVPNVPIINGYTGEPEIHNVIYVATAHNTLYAFDADRNDRQNARPLWKRTFNYPRLEIGPVSSADVGTGDIFPEIGIIGTPVIDPGSKTLYVVVKTKEAGDFFQRLHAIDITNGQEKFGGPVLIQASVPGDGDGSDVDANGNPYVPFNSLRHNQRPALTLVNGVVYIAWAAHGDVIPYHGWIMGYDARTLQQKFVFNATPNGKTDPSGYPLGGGGIWMAGAGLAADAKGNLYFMTGNGTFDADNPTVSPSDYGDSILRLPTTPTGTLDYFTPFNQDALNNADADLGSGGVLLLPDSVGSAAHPHLLVSAGKEGKIYLVDRDAMGHYNAVNDSQIVQSIPDAIGGAWSSPAYFDGKIYYQGVGDVLKVFSIRNGRLSDTPILQGATSAGYPGATPIVSANGATDGIVWTLERYSPPDGRPPASLLRAYDANGLTPLYSSFAAGGRDSAGNHVKFAVPTVANGKVYVGGDGLLTVFGMTPETPVEADHFSITGPVVFAPILTLVQQNVGNFYSVTALGIDGLPIKINGPVYLANDANGGLRFVSTLNFKNQSNVVFPRAFPPYVGGGNSLEGFDLIAVDKDGHSGASFLITVPSPLNPGGVGGLDHLVVRTQNTVPDGDIIMVTVKAVTATNSPIAVFDPVIVYYTTPEGDYNYDNIVTDSFQDPVTGEARSQITIPIRMVGRGAHVLVVTNVQNTGTTAVIVVPKPRRE